MKYKGCKLIYEDKHKCLNGATIFSTVQHHRMLKISRISLAIYHSNGVVLPIPEVKSTAFLGDATQAVKEVQHLFNAEIKRQNRLGPTTE